ncbi:unnamed protein product [Mytilus edulis]|uniref:C2H2-type domain-containing protein n=1 Tax=Mytilus edulis TaxID=6550 RepID=A0A8S3Q4T8_MYTED|nr:unnamed protein product [Mytilus edulis]
MIKESIDLVNGDADTMVQRILELSNAENILHQYRDLMHPGFYFVGDNLDMRTKVKNMTIYNQHKDHHMYQICACRKQDFRNHLDNTVVKGDANTVIWKLLYSTSSARDQGTLYAARNTINARNVTQDPADDFYAASDLVEKVTTAYIITGGLTHFGMESIDSLPCKNVYEGAVGNTNEMKEYIFDQARSFVKTFTLPEIPKLPEYGPNCNTYNCRYCGKKYKQPHSLRKHESSIHGHYDPLFAKEKVSSGKDNENESDGVSAYTKLVLTLGLLRMDHNDAIHMGDGSRMLRIDQFLVLYYKYCHCTKYAFGTLETIAQTEVLLTERQAHRLIWNRTVNHKGDANTNHPNDLDVEHCNKVFKDSAHSYRGVFTEKVVSRVSKSAMKVHEIIRQFDKMCNVHVPSGRHRT